ncbi:hypothetical protein N7470_001651 [Penicillium chermesinum]|nr:hypothetical protein N7470_001651 [Penicillium chermesinum]
MSQNSEDYEVPEEGERINQKTGHNDTKVGRHEYRASMKSLHHANVKDGRGELGRVRVFGDKTERELLMRVASRTVREGDYPDRKIILRDLEWLEDPASLERHTGRLLENGKVERAAEMVREAQRRQMRCVVSWNRIIEFCAKLGHMKPALRFFNDMKKRGGKPNAQTITIILSGMKISPPVQGINLMQIAEGLVKSLSAPNSEVAPNLYHMNALLSVCQSHGTLEDLWRIAGDLPEEGPLSPDASTYSTIVLALREFAQRDIQTMTNIEEITARKNQMVKEAKRIWSDVLHRWTHDELKVDNRLVQAFASVFLEGAADHDYYDVLALYNQTMGLPIKAPQPAERTKVSPWMKGQMKRAIDAQKAAGAANEEDQNQALQLGRDGHPRQETHYTEKVAEEGEEGEEEEEEENFDSLFDPITKYEGLELLRPDSKDLSMILHACHSLTQGMGAGVGYWETLTSGPEPLVTPNKFAIIQYLRLLRLSRSSKKSVQVLKDHREILKDESGSAFRIALSCCVRDKKNWSAFMHANEIMQLLGDTMVLPDQRAIEAYIGFINDLSQQPGLLIHTKGLGLLIYNFAPSTLCVLTFQRLDDAFTNGKPKPISRWSDREAPEWVAGDKVVKNMARVRLLVGDVLKVENAIFVSKKEREMLESDSALLGRYSDKELRHTSRRKIYPTKEQRERFENKASTVTSEDTRDVKKTETQEKLEERPKESKQAEISDESQPAKPEEPNASEATSKSAAKSEA